MSLDYFMEVMMKIIVPIPIKMVITDDSKEKLLKEYKDSIHQLKIELEQLQFQQKKLIIEAQKKGSEAVRIVQDRIGYEHQKRKEKIERLVHQIEQVSSLSDGDEILHSTVDSEIEINIGDSWDDIMNHKEIIITDGKIVDIRKGGR